MPVSEIVIGEPEALLITDRVPAAEPAVEGENVIVSVTLRPGVNVAGRFKAVRVNAVPLSVI